MSGDYDPIVPIRVERQLWRFPVQVREEAESFLLDLCEDPEPSWSGPFNDRAGGSRRFRIDHPDVSGTISVGYGIDRKNRRVIITSVEVEETEGSGAAELRFFVKGRQGKPATEQLLADIRRTGPKGFAKVLGLVSELIDGTVEYPHIKSLTGFPGLDELRTDFGNLRYRKFCSRMTGPGHRRLMVLLSGLIKKDQEANQTEIEEAFDLMRIARRDPYGNSLSLDEVSTASLRLLVEELTGS